MLFYLSKFCLAGLNLILIEFVCALIKVWGIEMIYEWCVFLLFPLCLIFAGISDAISLTIPNKVSLILVAGFVCLAPFSGLSLEAIGVHVLVGFSVLVIGIAFFAMNWLGGGDVKLIAACALWFGADNLAPFLFAMAIYGGVLCLVMVEIQHSKFLLRFSKGAWLNHLISQKSMVPYGIAIGLAGLSVYPQTHWLGMI